MLYRANFAKKAKSDAKQNQATAVAIASRTPLENRATRRAEQNQGSSVSRLGRHRGGVSATTPGAGFAFAERSEEEQNHPHGSKPI